MPDYYNTLRNVLIALLLPAIMVGAPSSPELSAAEQTLGAIRDCMGRLPAPWPDEWKQEYVETIRMAAESHGDAPQYAVRLEILRKGFGPYWESLKKSKDRASFEVRLAGIRWYTEHLMDAKLLSAEERQKLRNQYKDLWDHAACSLLTQFPFLDPNTTHLAKTDHLSQCYLEIEAPLLPIYLHPFSQAQMDKIKQRWGDLRYARVDMWRSLGGEAIMAVDKQQSESPRTHPHYVLTQRSLAQLLGRIWAIAATAPDYYRSAMGNWINAEQRRYQSSRAAWSNERRLTRELAQAEHISVLLAALLETPQCFDGSASTRAYDDTLLEQLDKPAKGGGAYEIETISPEK